MSCWCAVPKCTNNSSRKVHKLSFFRFPKDTERWRKWIDCIDRRDLLEKPSLYAYKNCFVCSEHFEAKFFLNDLRNRLQPTAFPTVFKHRQNKGSSGSVGGSPSLSTAESLILYGDAESSEHAKKRQLPPEGSTSGNVEPPQIVCVKSEASSDVDDASGQSSPVCKGKEATDPLEDTPTSTNSACISEFLSKAELGKLRDELCRVCGAKQTALSPICTGDCDGENPPLVVKIEMHLPLQINPNEGLPSNICSSCRELVESWHKLHQSSLDVDCMLRKMFTSNTDEIVLGNKTVETSLRMKPTQKFQNLLENCKFLGSKTKRNRAGEHNMEDLQAIGTNRKYEKVDKETHMEVDHTYMKSTSVSTAMTVSENLPHRCKYCGETFGSKKEFVQHKKPCSEEPTVCDMCGERVPQRCQLNKHIRKHLLVCTSFVCEACDQKFTSAEGLQCHMNTRHNGEETMKYFCEPCCKLFVNEQTYKRHEQHHEKGLLKSLNFKLVPAQESGSEKMFICPVCEGTFSDKMSLIVHMNTAKKKKCSKCKEWIRTEKQSLLHKCKQRICQYCGKRFNTRVGLYAHELIHKREKRFACQTCGAKFVTSSAVIQHRVIHDPPSFQCGECGKQFKLRYSYEDHMRDHLGIKHICPYCDKKFTARKSLYRHKRKCHLVR